MRFPERVRQQLPERGRWIVDAIEDKPAPLRTALYLGPSGVLMLLISAFVASTNAVCVDNCVRVGEDLAEQLLECTDHCLVHGQVSQTSSEAQTCEDKCRSSVGYTSGQVKRRQEDCIESCSHATWMLRITAFLGVISLLPVVPFLGSYRNACSCECCKGQGCTPKTAFFSVAWTSYGLSCLWVLPSVLEDSAEVGGKVLFVIAQSIAMFAMHASRTVAEQAEARDNDIAYRMANASGSIPQPGGSAQLASLVGQPISIFEPLVQELQAKVADLEEQVRELTWRQERLEEAKLKVAAEPSEPAELL